MSVSNYFATPKGIPSILGITGAVFCTTVIYSFVRDKIKYTQTLPEEINARIDESIDDRIIKKALKTKRVKKIIDHDSLTKNDVHKLALEVNGSMFHFSGNCALLSRCFLYNLKKGETILAAKNTFPIYLGVEVTIADKIIFGHPLFTIASDISGIDNLEKMLLTNHEKTGERFYIVNSYNYRIILVGETGHSFNAAILFDKHQKPYVQFIDSWKTSNHTPSKLELSRRYRDDAEFELIATPLKPNRPLAIPEKVANSEN